jgi:aspartyl protease family protein
MVMSLSIVAQSSALRAAASNQKQRIKLSNCLSCPRNAAVHLQFDTVFSGKMGCNSDQPMSQLTNLVFAALIGSGALAGMVVQSHDRQKQMKQDSKVTTASMPMRSGNAAAPAPAGNTAMIYSDPRGHFYADIQVRGIPIRTMVDTGASLVALSTEDAAKIGLRANPSDRKAQFNTANGVVTASLVQLPEVRLQGLTVFDVEAAIMPPGAMSGTLLGMSFMKKLASFESRGSSMVMRK